MTDLTPAAAALAAYDDLYRSPETGKHIIDGDEAQVAADLAAVVRSLPDHPFLPERPIHPTRIVESHRAGGAMFVQLAGTPEEQVQLLESLARDIAEEKLLRDLVAKIEALSKPTESGRYAEAGYNDHFNDGVQAAAILIEEMLDA